MRKKFSEYINALHTIHGKDSFWVLDNRCKLIHNNNCVNPLESLRVISKHKVSSPLLEYLENNKDTPDNMSEIVVFSNDINSKYLLLINVHKIIKNDEMLGYFLIIQGKVDEFESSRILNLLLHKNKHTECPPISLKEREKEVLYLVSRGKSYKEIANMLSDKYHKRIAPTTIASSVQNCLYRKFNVVNMLDLKSKAIEFNLINHIPASLFRKLDN